MPTESSYADRLGRAQLMQGTIALFTPAFAPADATLTAAGFAGFCSTVETACDETAVALDAWRTVVKERQDLVKELKATATRVIAYLNSSAAFAGALRNAKAAADKLRGMKPRAPKTPEPAPGSPAAKPRNSGDLSYADIEKHFKVLINAVTGLAGYAPVPAGNPITLANLSATLSAYKGKNSALIILESTWRDKVDQRSAKFDAPGGLREKMKAIKNATKAQYGQASSQYSQVKNIKL
jgi:hypothetical protein